MRAYLSNHNPVHDRVIRAFAEGCGAKLVDGWRYEPAEISIVFGVHKDKAPISWPRGKIIAKAQRDGGRVLILETGYIRRGDGADHYYAAGWGGLNGRADFRNHGSSKDRWEQLGIGLGSWRSDASAVVVCGQVPWDASVQHSDHRIWCQMVCARLARAGCDVVFRPHPLAKGVNYGVVNCEISIGELASDLERANRVVTFNSNTAVDAICQGVPAVSMDVGSMAWDVSAHEPEARITPDREQWAYNLAYTQWTPHEMRRGLAWEHLRK